MPKITGTNIEKLAAEFKAKKKLTTKAIQAMFPRANVASMVWQLQYRKGLTFTKIAEGNKIVAYQYIPGVTGIIINGSKRLWEEANAHK